ncbi:hypothetical protein LTR85_007998 [Meristemomyces frigidus]|nr:hypothetical protein LTR85_007998 [Meristemomyces frigidus]
MASSSVAIKAAETRKEAEDYLELRLRGSETDSLVEPSIPIIDIGDTFESSLPDKQKAAEEIRRACITSGFFIITSHGISTKARGDILDQAKSLFTKTPREQKQLIHIKHSLYGYGWEPSDATTIAGDVETKEAFNWSYEDDLDVSGGDSGYVQLDGSSVSNVNQWPDEPLLPGFYGGIKDYYGQALGLARHLCKLFALSLRLPEDYFDSMTTHPSGNSRLMYYPPAEPVAESKDGVGLGAHSDYQCFTILLCSSTPGLEILSPSGRWIAAPVVQDGLVINIGDMMMRWTNGLFKSTVHRVVNRTGEERYSVPLFFGVNNDHIVEGET